MKKQQPYSRRPPGSKPESVEQIDRDMVADAHLVDFARVKPTQLRAITRLLLVAHSRPERYIVGLHYLHSVPLPAIAKLLYVTPARAADLHRSILKRLAIADGMHANEVTLQQLLAPPKRKAKTK